MKHLPGSVISEEEALGWGKYVGIDEDGSARVFKKEPIKIGSTWVPDKFPSKMYPACYRMNVEYPEHMHGKKLKRRKQDGEKFYEPVT
jgi:hypothetical protein